MLRVMHTWIGVLCQLWRSFFQKIQTCKILAPAVLCCAVLCCAVLLSISELLTYIYLFKNCALFCGDCQ